MGSIGYLKRFKKLAHMIVGAGMSEIHRADQQVEIQVRVDVATLSLKFAEQDSRCFYVCSLEAELLLPLETSVFTSNQGLPLVG